MAQRVVGRFRNEDSGAVAVDRLQAESFCTISQFALSDGQWTVAVIAPFGRAATAIKIMKASGAIEVHEDLTSTKKRGSDHDLVAALIYARYSRSDQGLNADGLAISVLSRFSRTAFLTRSE